MATYVLVHGGGYGGWRYKKVKQRLEARGHEVFALRSPGWPSTHT
jgi:alpha-beta hydrolase superfamily lysophospholipase